MSEQNGTAPTESFEDVIRTHLIENRQTLVRQAVGSAMERMAESMKWTAMEHANKELNQFFKDHVGPEIAKYLTENREALVAQVITTIKTVLDAGLKKQAEEWVKEMDSKYSRARTIAEMFGSK